MLGRANDGGLHGPDYVIAQLTPTSPGGCREQRGRMKIAIINNPRTRRTRPESQADGGGLMAFDGPVTPSVILAGAAAMLELAAVTRYLCAVARGDTRPSRIT
jgi:hypothetical protein